MKKLAHLISLLILSGLTLGIVSCLQGDDDPCNGVQYVYLVKSNKLIEALNTDSNQYFLYTNLNDSLSKPDSIQLSVRVDTPFVKRYRDYKSNCYECGAEVETFVATISKIPNQDDFTLEYDECLGYTMRLGLNVISINNGLRYVTFQRDIKLNDTFGIDHIIYKDNFKIERL